MPLENEKTIRDIVRECLDDPRFAGKKKIEIVKHVKEIKGGKDNRWIYKVIKQELDRRNVTKEKPKSRNLPTISADELIDREKLDKARILRKALADLGKGECIYDDELRRAARINTTDWRNLREQPGFRKYQVQTRANKKRIWTHPDTKRELLENLDGTLIDI